MKRWKALDRELSDRNRGLHVPTFARQHRVTIRTVNRDLAAFNAIGQTTESERLFGDTQYHSTYCNGVDPLFLSSFPLELLKAWEAPEVRDAIKNAIAKARGTI